MTFYRLCLLLAFVLGVLRLTVTPKMPSWVAWGPLIVLGAWSGFVLVICMIDIFFGRRLEERAAMRRLRKRRAQIASKLRTIKGGLN